MQHKLLVVFVLALIATVQAKSFFQELKDDVTQVKNKIKAVVEKAEDKVEAVVDKVVDGVEDYAEELVGKVDFVPMIKESIMKTKIPNMGFEFKVPLIGNVIINITNFKILDFDGKGKVSFPGKKLIQVDIAKFDGAVASDWKAQQQSWPHLGDNGSFNGKVLNAFVSVVVEITESLNPFKIMFGSFDAGNAIKVNSINLKLDVLDAKIEGGVGLLYSSINKMSEVFKETIKKKIEEEVKKAAPPIINQKIKEILEAKFGKDKKPLIKAFQSSKPAQKTQFYILRRNAVSFKTPAKNGVKSREFKKGTTVTVVKQQNGFGLVSKQAWLPMSVLSKK